MRGNGVIYHCVDGVELQDGTTGYDQMAGAAAGDDGSMILVGYVGGSWASTHQGSRDFAAAKLDSNGTVVWTWQVLSRRLSMGFQWV